MNTEELLKVLHNEVSTEHTLIANRLNWFATSQSFLVAAFTNTLQKSTSSSANTQFSFPASITDFFQFGIPILGLLISVSIWLAILAAISAQIKLINKEADCITKMIDRTNRENRNNLQSYSDSIVCKNREAGKIIHFFGMFPPMIIPFLFISFWSYLLTTINNFHLRWIVIIVFLVLVIFLTRQIIYLWTLGRMPPCIANIEKRLADIFKIPYNLISKIRK